MESGYLALGHETGRALAGRDRTALRKLTDQGVTLTFLGDGRISGTVEGVDAVIARLADTTSGEPRVGAGREHRRRPGRLVPPAEPVRLRRPEGRRAGHAALPSLNYASRVARLGCRTRSRRLHGCSRAAAADVQDRQRGEAGQVVEHRMSGFCGNQAGNMAALALRSGPFGHPHDRPRGRPTHLSCGNVRKFS